MINEKLIEKNIMTIGLNNNTSSLGAVKKIPLNVLYNSIGKKLTFDSSNNGIKIGSDVKKVVVSGQIQIQYSSANGQYSGKVYKNSTEINAAYTSQYKSGTSPITLNISPTLIDVEEDDVIYLYLTFGTSIIRPESYLTVEVID